MSYSYSSIARRAADFSDPARLTLQTPKSVISVARYGHSQGSTPKRFDTTSEDAFLAIFQFRSHTSHRIWVNGQPSVAPSAGIGI
jgi:hypothetical protein